MCFLTLALVYLSYQGYVDTDYDALAVGAKDALGLTGAAAEWIVPIIAHLPCAGAFGPAFFLGFKMGRPLPSSDLTKKGEEERFAYTFPA